MTDPVIVTRAAKGNALTWEEGDANFTNLRDAIVALGSGSSYTLPTASPTILGGVKIDNSTITISGTGVISAVSSGGGGGIGLSSTSIKTSNYTATAYDLVRCDTSSGAFSVTLPIPADSSIIGIVDIGLSFGTNNLTLIPASGTTIESDATSVILDINGSYVTFMYNATTSNWKLLQNLSALTSLPIQTSNSGKYLTTNGTVASWTSLGGVSFENTFLLMGS